MNNAGVEGHGTQSQWGSTTSVRDACGAILIAFMAACGTLPPENIHEAPRTRPGVSWNDRTTSIEPKEPNGVAHTAGQFVGAYYLSSHGKRVWIDCSTLVRHVYLRHGIDLYGEGLGRSGVHHIYEYVKTHGRLYQNERPHPGDLVFFHNTVDLDRDGRSNDRLTHVGIVEEVMSDGTVQFISRVSEGVQRYRLNLTAPHRHRMADGWVVNDYLRRKRVFDGQDTRYLAGELFASFGSVGR